MEDKEPGDENKIGRLHVSLYGTRDAAQNWEKTYSQFLLDLGFTQGKSSPCLFEKSNHGKEISITVHGDDFVIAANLNDIKWIRTQMEEKFEVKSEILGPDEGCSPHVRVLNRIISWEKDGLAYEADPRHAEILFDGLGLESAKGVRTPGKLTGPRSTT